MEEIFNSLTKIHVFGVISHTSVEQYRNTTKPVSEIGKTLDVDYIVEGSGQKFGNTFRIRVQLIDANTDMHIWSKSFQYKMKETHKLFRIQSRIAKNIASELKATLTRKERELIEKVPTENNAAYNLYLKANSYIKDYEITRNTGTYLLLLICIMPPLSWIPLLPGHTPDSPLHSGKGITMKPILRKTIWIPALFWQRRLSRLIISLMKHIL